MKRLAAFMIGLAVSTAALAGSARSLPTSFTLRGLTGGVVKRSELEGKIVVMQFFASWCKGCGEVMAQVAPVIGTKTGVRYLPISVDESMSEAKGYFKAQRDAVKPVERLAVLDKDAAIATALGVEALPAIVVVDAKGRVIQSFSGHPSAEQMRRIEQLAEK